MLLLNTRLAFSNQSNEQRELHNSVPNFRMAPLAMELIDKQKICYLFFIALVVECLLSKKLKGGLNESIELRFDQFLFRCQYFVNNKAYRHVIDRSLLTHIINIINAKIYHLTKDGRLVELLLQKIVM